MNNGGLTHNNKSGLGHNGVHIARYNSTVTKRPSPGPGHKATPTFYYQSDGSGRDGYVLRDNGGLRPEYDRYNKSNQVIFINSLRSEPKSKIKYFRDLTDRADITTYRNWKSRQAKRVNREHAVI